MRGVLRKILASLIVLVSVAAFGAAHGGLMHQESRPDLKDVVYGLCQGGSDKIYWPEGVPRHPASRSFSYPVKDGWTLLFSRVPAPLHAIQRFYTTAMTRAGWRNICPSKACDPLLLWFRKGERECLLSFSSMGGGESDVIIIVR